MRPEQLEDEREHMSADYFAQEFLCQFVDNGTELFATELLENALDDELEPVFC